MAGRRGTQTGTGTDRAGRLRRPVVVGLVALAVLLLAGCAAGPNDVAAVGTGSAHLAGFWLGLWHGLISPITFIVSLFNHHVSIYEVHNNGGWYNFGFLFGASIVFSGSSGSASRRRSRCS